MGVLGLGLGLAAEVAAAPPPALGGGGNAGPEEEACSGRAVGDACTLPNNQLGTCATGTCNRLDYSQGSPPKAIEEACVVCQAGGAGHGGPPTLGSGGAPPEDTGASEGGPSGSGDDTRNTGKEPPESSSRCALVDLDGDSGPLGLLTLGMMLGLLALRRP